MAGVAAQVLIGEKQHFFPAGKAPFQDVAGIA